MLTANYLDNVAPDVEDLYRRFETQILKDMSKRVANANYNISSTVEWQINQSQEMGIIYENMIKRIAEINSISEKKVATAFNKAGVTALRYDDAIYSAVGLEPLPIKQSPSMLQILNAGVVKNNNNLKNLTMTTMNTGKELYQRATDLAYTQISSGAYTYQEAIKHAVGGMANEGLTAIEYATGSRINLTSAVRRSLLTGVNQTAGKMQEGRAEEMGSNLVETTAHQGSRPSHALWQGKVFSRLGGDAKYPNFVENTNYGSVEGLCGANCRHNFFPFFEGLSEEAYSKKEVDDYNNQEVSYTDANGKRTEMTYYEATQRLRSIEGNVRKYKLKSGMFEEAGIENSFEMGKINKWQGTARDFVKQTGVKRDYFREKVLMGK